MKYLKNISNFNKKFLIKENKQQAESILSKLGLDVTNSDYKEIRELVGNNTNYLGLFTKFFFQQKASMDDLDKLIEFLKSDDAKKLNKNPLKYDFEELYDEITEIETDKQVMDFYNELTNDQKDFTDLNNKEFRSLAEQFFTIKSKAGFFKNISKIKTFNSLISSMEDYIEKYNKYGSYESVIEILNSNPDKFDIVLNDKENEIIIAKVKNYDGSKLIGSENWCIVNSVSHWTSYTSSTPRNQYFVWNFGLDLSNPNYYTAYTISMGDTFYAAFDFNNKAIKTSLPKHIKDNKDFLKGPDEKDLDEIQLRKLREEEERLKEQRERQLRILREKQARAEEHRNEELFETWEPAKAMIEFLTDEENLEIGEDEDIYDVVFFENWNHYGMPIFSTVDSEFCIGTYNQANDAAYESIKSYIDDVGYQFNLDLSDYIDKKALGSYIASWDEDHIRDEWKDYGIDAEVTNRGKNKVDSIVNFLMELEDIDSDMKERIDSIQPFNINELDKDEQLEYISNLEEILGDLEGNFTNEDDDILYELEEEREKFYELSQELQDENDDDYWEMSEDAYDNYISEKEREIQDDPIDYLRSYFGYGENEIKTYIEDYIDERELIEDIIRMDGFGHTLSSYDGEQYEINYNDTDYYIFKLN